LNSGQQRGKRARTDAERAVAERLLQVLRHGGDVRSRVRRVRAKVIDGSYENNLKLSVALERLIQELRR
jgi:hypothetical protein